MAFRNEREGREKERKKEGNEKKEHGRQQISVIPSECDVMNYLAMPQDNQ